MFQDRYGFMWFATLDGLNRYDGYRFVVYRHDVHDPASITESFVQTIFEDSKGRLWIGTISGGLDLFDRETETFIHIKHQDGNAATLSAGAVTSIAEDSQGIIWVHVFDKVDKITIHKKEKVFGEAFSIHHVQVPFHSEYSFLSISKRGNIYYANAMVGVIYKLDDEKRERWSVTLNLHDYVQQQTINSAPKYRIVQLLEDKVQGTFYIFHEGGVIRFNEKTSAPEKLFRNEFFKNYPIPLHASLDSHGVAWFPGKNNLAFFDTHSGGLNYTMSKESDISRSVKHSYSTFIDRSGLLWIGTSGYGILKRNTHSETFHHTSTAYTYSIKRSGDGKIIIGNALSAQAVFHKTKGEWLAATSGRRTKNGTKYVTNFLVSPVATDKSGAWFAESNSLRFYDTASKKTTYYRYP